MECGILRYGVWSMGCTCMSYGVWDFEVWNMGF